VENASNFLLKMMVSAPSLQKPEGFRANAGKAFYPFYHLFYATIRLVVMAALALHGVDDGFDDNEGHAHTDDAQRVPQATVKNIVAHIPYPLKTDEWQH
jgi:hypothetical protein